jgi:hypothetical protein
MMQGLCSRSCLKCSEPNPAVVSVCAEQVQAGSGEPHAA